MLEGPCTWAQRAQCSCAWSTNATSNRSHAYRSGIAPSNTPAAEKNRKDVKQNAGRQACYAVEFEPLDNSLLGCLVRIGTTIKHSLHICSIGLALGARQGCHPDRAIE